MTLRGVVLACSVLLTIAGLILIGFRLQPGLQLAIGAGIFSILVVGECWRYRRAHGVEEADGFLSTDERFRDPTTGEWMSVEFNSATGARRYVKASKPPTESDM